MTIRIVASKRKILYILIVALFVSVGILFVQYELYKQPPVRDQVATTPPFNNNDDLLDQRGPSSSIENGGEAIQEKLNEEVGSSSVKIIDYSNSLEGSTGSTTADSADDEPSTSSSASSEKDSNSKSGITSPSSTTARVAHFWDNYPDQCQSYFNPAKRESSAHFHTLKSHELRHKYGDDGSDIPKIIHFIAYNHNLKSARYLCSVESVLKHNPDHTVYIYTPFPQLFEKDIKSWRRKHDMRDKVKVVRMDFRSVFKGNKLEKWFTTKKYEKSHWVDQNLGNAFRLGLLWKFGGTYLDLDIVSLNPLTLTNSENGTPYSMGKFIAREEGEQLNNAALRFPPNDIFLEAIINDFVNNFDGYTWAHNGPFCITRSYREKCYPKLSNYTPDSEPKNSYCYDVSVLDIDRFYPIHFRETDKFKARFDKVCDLLDKMAVSSFGIHWWHKGFEVEDSQQNKMTSESLLAQVFQNECPAVVKAFGWKNLHFAQ